MFFNPYTSDVRTQYGSYFFYFLKKEYASAEQNYLNVYLEKEQRSIDFSGARFYFSYMWTRDRPNQD